MKGGGPKTAPRIAVRGPCHDAARERLSATQCFNPSALATAAEAASAVPAACVAGYPPAALGRAPAFGLGLERIAQLRHGVPDVRLLWDSDLRVISQF
jgi:hypothetical protein